MLRSRTCLTIAVFPLRQTCSCLCSHSIFGYRATVRCYFQGRHRLCRAFPAETHACRHRRWQTFEWETTHDPAFSLRLQHSGDTWFKRATPHRHWGTDPKYGQLLSEFREVQLELGEFGVLSKADVDSETNTGHGNASRLH